MYLRKSVNIFNKHGLTKFGVTIILLTLILSAISAAVAHPEFQLDEVEPVNGYGVINTFNEINKNRIPSDSEPNINSKPQQIQSLNYPYNYTDVMVIYNEASAMSVQIAEYFKQTRNIADINMCNITGPTGEVVSRTNFEIMRAQIESYLINNNLTNKINYFVTTKGVPLKISEENTANDDWSYPSTIDRASFDEEISMILGPYQNQIGTGGFFLNPVYEETREFSRGEQGIFLVTRLTGYEWPEIKNVIDNGNISYGYHGDNFVLDVDPGKDGNPGYKIGNDWLRNANIILTTRGYNTYLDQSNTFVTDQTEVAGYGSWGSNDGHYSSNHVLNNGLETDNSPADGIPDNWFVEHDQGVDNVSRNNTWSQQGSWSFNITRNATNSNFTAISQNISIQPNVRFYLTGYVNCSNVSNDKGAHLMIRAYDASNNLLQTINSTRIRKGTANNFQGLGQTRYEIIPNAVKLTISGVLSKSLGTAFFDNIRLWEIKPHNTWIPGGIAETFVSTGGRSFKITTTYGQSLVADLIREGVSGVKGYVYEPYLTAIAHPDILFDRYTLGYNLAESYWYASQLYGWMGTVIGDPKIQPYHDLLPDAEIVKTNITFSNPTPNINEDIIIYADVLNSGNASLYNMVVRFYLGDPSEDVQIGERNITSLGKLQSINVNITWNTETNTQNQTIYVVVDPDGLIKEQYEKNNNASKMIYINEQPMILSKEYSSTEIFRTETVVIDVYPYDLESLDSDIDVLAQCKIKDANEWINISDSAVYNTDHWELTFTPGIDADVGRYTFEFRVVDENNCFSLTYYDHAILTVHNNKPIVDEFGLVVDSIDPAVYLRTQNIQVYTVCNDIEIVDELNASMMTVDIRYMSPISGWVEIMGDIEFLGSVGQGYRWEIAFSFDEDSTLGLYSLSARVKDKDEDYSDWAFKNDSFVLMNNLPEIWNLTLDRISINRSESVIVTYQTKDIENDQFGLSTELEYQLINQSDPSNLPDELWSSELISGPAYDNYYNIWSAEFITAYETELGEYIFRARVTDEDGNQSEWLVMHNTTLWVNNNPPVADIGYVPNEVDEDDEISFDPTDSYDKESPSSELEYFWDFGDGATSMKSKVKHVYATQGTYLVSLTVKDGDGTEVEVNKSINVVNVKPQVTINVNKTIANVYDSLTFSSEGTWDTPSDFNGLVYRWDFGDGTIEQDAGLNMTNHTYTVEGTYVIKLTVFDDDDANETDEVKVKINSLPDMDGDGTPDTIDPDIDGDGVPNEEDKFPYDNSKSGQEKGDDEDSDLTSTYIMVGIVLIIICIIVILIIFIRPKDKYKSKDRLHPPPPLDLKHPNEMETDDEKTAEIDEPLPPPPEDIDISEPGRKPGVTEEEDGLETEE
jgi:uncharacterized protein (TIGR03790 family)